MLHTKAIAVEGVMLDFPVHVTCIFLLEYIPDCSIRVYQSFQEGAHVTSKYNKLVCYVCHSFFCLPH